MKNLEGETVLIHETDSRKLKSELSKFKGSMGEVLMSLENQGYVVEFADNSKRLFPFSNVALLGNVLQVESDCFVWNKLGSGNEDNYLLRQFKKEEDIKDFLEARPHLKEIVITNTYRLEHGWVRNNKLIPEN